MNRINKHLHTVNNFFYIINEYKKNDKAIFYLSFAQIPFESLSSVLLILIPKVIFDSLEYNRELVPTATIIIAISCAVALADIGKQRIGHKLTMESLKLGSFHFRQSISFKAMDMDYENFISPEGKLYYEKAIQSIEGGFGKTIIGFFPSIINLFSKALGFLSFTAILISLNPFIVLALTLTYLLDSILMIYISKIIQNSKNERSEVFKKLRYLVQITKDAGFAKDIRIYSMSDWLKSISKHLADKNARLERQVFKKQFALLMVEGLLILLRDGLAYAYLISRFISKNPEKQITIGDFTLFFAAIAGFGNWLSSIVSNAQTVIATSYSVSDYRNFISLPDNINRLPKISLSAAKEKPVISLRNVSFSYKQSNKMILDSISLTIHSGEKVALVGVNGAGKTTLISLICGLLLPSAGEVLINGHSINDYGRDHYYALFTTLFQNSGVIPSTIEKNISLGYNGDKLKLRNCIEKAGLNEIIRELPNGVNTELLNTVTQGAITLSGGETQRLLLARALYKDSPILILDEPSAALDPIAESRLYQKYNEIASNKTVIFVSHRLASTQFCDRIFLLDGGNIIESGTHIELLGLKGKYAEMFEKQSYYYKQNKGAEVI